MDRREILRATGVTAVTALAGCLSEPAPGQTATATDEPAPEQTATATDEPAAYEAPIREFWTAYGEENASAMRDTYHPDSPQGFSEDAVEFGNEISLGGFTVTDRTDDALTVEVDATVTESEQTRSVTHTYELRRTEGAWAIWRFTTGTEQSGTAAPAAAFEFEYDRSATDSPDTGVVAITHSGGDNIDAAALSVRGTGIVAPTGAQPDITAAGTSWASATGTSEVAAGISVTVGVASDFEVRVIWQAADEETSAVLAQYDGTDA